MSDTKPLARVIASKDSWIEGEAVRQLEQTATLPGMRLVVGMPDLHPGKGNPVGAAFFSQGVFYPYLVGNDIGCGMGLWTTDLKQRKIKRDAWVRKLYGLEAPWEGSPHGWLNSQGVEPTGYEDALGTIGGGNHFAELQQVDEVVDADGLARLGVDPERLALLVHSGSRGLGEEVLRAHVDRFKAGGLAEDSDEARAYLARHAQAVAWASANRALIARRFLDALGAEGERVLDSSHNTVTSEVIGGERGWLHRKGAAPSDQGPLVIPGSRGALSYLVEPSADADHAARSVAHGAGRKWPRSEAKARLRQMTSKDLIRTELGSEVICEDKQLLFEEAPQAYKNISQVIQDLVDAGLVRVLAVLRPVITYKTRAGGGE